MTKRHRDDRLLGPERGPWGRRTRVHPSRVTVRTDLYPHTVTTTVLTSAKPRVHPALGVAMVLISGVLFAVNGTVSKLILEAGVDAQRLTLLRAVGAWTGLLILSAIVPGGLARLKVRRDELPLLFTYGITGFFLVPMLYFFSIKLLPVGIALLFEYMAPLLVALWARFGQHQQVKTRLWYGLALSLLGLAFVAEVWKGSLQLNGWGILAGLGAAVLLCFYYVLGAKGVTQRDTVSLTFWAFAVSGLAGLIVAGFRPGGIFPFEVFGQTSHGIPVWALAIYLIVGGSIASYLLVAAALRHLPPTSVGIIGMVEPVIAAGVAWFVLNERLTAPQLVGGALVLVGVGVAETARTMGPGEIAEIPPG
jgi:drug/metabolite transporter (DMT)-like permease